MVQEVTGAQYMKQVITGMVWNSDISSTDHHRAAQRAPKMPQMVSSAAAHFARMDGSRLLVNSFQKAAHLLPLIASGGARCARLFR